MPLVPVSRPILEPSLCRSYCPQFHAQSEPEASTDLDPRVGQLGLCIHHICHCLALIVGIGPGSCVSCHTPYSLLLHSPVEVAKPVPELKPREPSCGRMLLPPPGLLLYLGSAWPQRMLSWPSQMLGSCSAHFPSLWCDSSQGASPVVFPPLGLALSWAIAEKHQKNRLNQTKPASKADIPELLLWWKKRLKLLV